MKLTRREALLPPPPPRPVWRFYERHHPHSLWHGDFLEKVTLTDIDQTAYQLALQDDYSRGYVFCDLFLNPDIRTTIRALIAAMRAWLVPKAVMFDNGSPFKGIPHQAKFTLLRSPFAPARWSSTDRWAHSEWRVLRRIRMIKPGWSRI